MESNRDEAERCIQIASKAMCDGKFEKAEKFLLKAETLYPTKEAKVLLEKLTQTNKSNLNNENEAKFDGTHRRKSTASTQQKQQKDQQSSSEPEYTKDQLEHVKRIRKCKDYYEVLGVTKESPDSEIKKAYKKLALQLHPDKNNAPGSAEAFKAIGNAATVLTDPEKRKQYDAYGAEGLNGHMGRAGRGYGVNRGFEGFDGFTFSRGFESNATAEEIFNMFFGGGADTFSQGNVYRRQTRYQRTENARNEPQSNYTALINLAPILLLILLPMLTSFFTSDPIYTLQPSQKYTLRRQTNNLKVMYYVKENFHVEYQGSVGRLEASVEEEYIQNLKHACYRERNYKEAMLMKARNFGDRDLYKRSQTITTPSCEALHKIH